MKLAPFTTAVSDGFDRSDEVTKVRLDRVTSLRGLYPFETEMASYRTRSLKLRPETVPPDIVVISLPEIVPSLIELKGTAVALKSEDAELVERKTLAKAYTPLDDAGREV